MEKDQEFAEYVIKAIVDHPNDVKSERTIDERGVLISLKVNPEDMGQVIGHNGSTVSSLRTLLRVIGSKNNARVNLKILEPEGGRSSERNTGETKENASKKVEDVVNDLKL